MHGLYIELLSEVPLPVASYSKLCMHDIVRTHYVYTVQSYDNYVSPNVR